MTFSYFNYAVHGIALILLTSPVSSEVQILGPANQWFVVNDPVMGGLSTGAFSVNDDAVVLEGEVKIVPSLNAPGFISLQTREGPFPDLRSCNGLLLNVKSNNAYSAYHVSLGTNYAGSMPFVEGYKTPFEPTIGEFSKVYVPFTAFSDNWDPGTGAQVVTCEEDTQYCPDDKTLYNIERFEIMAEGEAGDVSIELKSVEATGCDDSLPSTYTENPPDTPQNSPMVLSNGDIRIESFASPYHSWFTVSDQVMGGVSNSDLNVVVNDGEAVFEGEIKNVESLGAPGFITMETRGGYFPDVSMCEALKINLRSETDYQGLHLSFGTRQAPGAARFVRGYRAELKDLPTGEQFTDVIVPFDHFSNDWDTHTGDITTSCSTNGDHCPDEDTLRDMTLFSLSGQGVAGKVKLEIKSIDATGCSGSAFKGSTFSSATTTTKKNINKNIIGIVGISFGFVFVALSAFLLGRRERKQRNFNFEPEIQEATQETEVTPTKANIV